MDSEKRPLKKKITDVKVALEKGRAYCVYQERCQQEVRDKLYEWGLWPDAVESIIGDLITENFLNEERFAKAYAGGKFRMKKWGRVKIKMELKKRKISDYCIKKGLAEIPNDDYVDALNDLIIKKLKSIKAGQAKAKFYKTAHYAISRGYESDLVWDILWEKE